MPSLFRKSYGDQTRNNLYYTLQGRQIQNIKLKREQGKSLGFCVCDLTSLFRVDPCGMLRPDFACLPRPRSINSAGPGPVGRCFEFKNYFFIKNSGITSPRMRSS